MTEQLVNQKNFSLGCRICRTTIIGSTSYVELSEIMSEFLDGNRVSYSDAFEACTGVQGLDGSDMPKKLCSDCASRLSIAYQLRRDTIESDKILRNFVELEESELAAYEGDELEEVEYIEYEELYEDDMDDENDESAGIKHEEEDDANDAVSFLTGILKPTKQEPEQKKRVKITKQLKITDSSSIDSDRKHVCNVCDKKFQKRSNLIDHLRLHANVKVFTCEYCDRSFVQAGNYKAHLRVHTKEKPYACETCGKAYSQSSSLKIHIRSHTQERNYICDMCEKGFTNASDLAKHRLIHDPNKKFKCEVCKRPFTQKVHLRKHCEKHHPELIFEMDNSGGVATYIIAEEIE